MEITTNRPDKLLPEVLKDALFGKQAHVSLERALEGLQWHQAGVEIAQYPHTIWQQLKHLNYWQDRFISRLEGMTVLPAKSSDEGWCFTKAPMDESEFRREVGKLLTGINYTAETILSDPEELSQQKGDYPHGFGVVQAMASHLSYHIGEIVLLRRMMGIWPPPSGGYSW